MFKKSEDKTQLNNQGQLNNAKSESNIRFKKDKSKERTKLAFKIVLFISIASFSGIITSVVALNIMAKNNGDYSDGLSLSDTIVDNSNKELINKLKEGIVKVENGSEKAMGLIYTSDGYIVTNNKIIENAQKANVTLSTGEKYEAKIVGIDVPSNIAILKIDAKDLPVISFADSSKVKAKDKVLYFTSYNGDDDSEDVVKAHILTTDKKLFEDETNQYPAKMYNIFKTDARLGALSECGVLSDESGEIVALSILDGKKKSDQSIVLTGNEVQRIVDSIIDEQQILKSSLGIVGRNAKSQGGSGVEGVYVQQVISTDKRQCTIRPTDIIVGINDKEVHNLEELTEILKQDKNKQNIKCTIWRSGEVIDTYLPFIK